MRELGGQPLSLPTFLASRPPECLGRPSVKQFNKTRKLGRLAKATQYIRLARHMVGASLLHRETRL